VIAPIRETFGFDEEAGGLRGGTATGARHCHDDFARRPAEKTLVLAGRYSERCEDKARLHGETLRVRPNANDRPAQVLEDLRGIRRAPKCSMTCIHWVGRGSAAHGVSPPHRHAPDCSHGNGAPRMSCNEGSRGAALAQSATRGGL